VSDEAKNILVVANETVTGRPLIDAVKRHADQGTVKVHVICPQNQPKHGYVIYDEAVSDAVKHRLELTVAQLKEAGIEATGELMDPNPYSAIMDALADRDYDAIIISTHPETRSGWLRQDLIQRVQQASRREVEHVVVDIGAEADAADVARTLVVANQTVAAAPLIEKLKELAAQKPHRFIVICPEGESTEGDAHARLAHTLEQLQNEGLQAIGQVAHPDPYTATQTAMQFYSPDEIVISTFPETRSGWLRANLVERVKETTLKPVVHVVSETEEATA
jgi:hypothetical protein